MCLCKRLHEGTLLKQTGNSRTNVTLTHWREIIVTPADTAMTRYLTEAHRHAYQNTQPWQGKFKVVWSLTVSVLHRKHRQSNRKRSERGLTILFGRLIVSHLPQCWSNGIRGDARTLHIFGLSARTCEYEPKIQGEGGRWGEINAIWEAERERERERESSRWINVFQMGLEMRGGGVLVG